MTSFAREWNAALALVAATAVILLAAGYVAAGAGAIALGTVAILARWSAMRRQNRGFYGQEKSTR